MNKKTKLALSGVGVSAVVAGVALTGGTSAYFYDLERSEGNSLAACSLDLIENGVRITQTQFAEGGTQSQAKSSVVNNDTADNQGAMPTISLSKLQPGDEFRVELDMKNVGSCDGELWGDVNFPIADLENGFLEPEVAAGDTTDDVYNANAPAGGIGGELDDFITVVYGPDDAANSFTGTYNELAYELPTMLDGNFEAGETETIKLTLTVPDNGSAGYGNEIMSDSFSFAIDFAAAQKNQIPRNAANQASVDLNNMP